MKLFFKPALAIIALTTLFACHKEVIKQSAAIVSLSQDDARSCVNGTWLGNYATPGLPFLSVTDSVFINDGVAKLTTSPWSYFYSAIELPISKCHQFSGDSAKLVVYLKNPTGTSLSVYPFDVTLRLYGTKDTAEVYFLGDLQQYTSLHVGNIGITNSPQLIHTFEDWTEVTLEAKNKRLTVYLNGVPVQQVVYKGNKIGILKSINIGFKGAGTVDWVKLYNSNTNTQLMQEDFNVNMQSSVNWF